jgi:hypothetical protein
MRGSADTRLGRRWDLITALATNPDHWEALYSHQACLHHFLIMTFDVYSLASSPDNLCLRRMGSVARL